MTIPPLNTQPEIIDDTAAPLTGIDTGAFLPPTLGTILSRLIPPPPPPPVVTEPVNSPADHGHQRRASREVNTESDSGLSASRDCSSYFGNGPVDWSAAKDGTVERIRVVTGPALLVQAALDAVRQWMYRPTMLNNKPVEVIAPIAVNFTLTQ